MLKEHLSELNIKILTTVKQGQTVHKTAIEREVGNRPRGKQERRQRVDTFFMPKLKCTTQ